MSKEYNDAVEKYGEPICPKCNQPCWDFWGTVVCLKCNKDAKFDKKGNIDRDSLISKIAKNVHTD